jgi:hypothetical protein
MFIEKSFGRHDYAFKSLLDRQFVLQAVARPLDPAGYTRADPEMMVLSGRGLLTALQDAQQNGRWSPAGPVAASGLGNRLASAYLTADSLVTVSASDARALAAALRVVAAGVARGEQKYAAQCASLADFADASGGFSIAS